MEGLIIWPVCITSHAPVSYHQPQFPVSIWYHLEFRVLASNMLLTTPCDVLATFKRLVEISGWSQVTPPDKSIEIVQYMHHIIIPILLSSY